MGGPKLTVFLVMIDLEVSVCDPAMAHVIRMRSLLSNLCRTFLPGTELGKGGADATPFLLGCLSISTETSSVAAILKPALGTEDLKGRVLPSNATWDAAEPAALATQVRTTATCGAMDLTIPWLPQDKTTCDSENPKRKPSASWMKVKLT